MDFELVAIAVGDVVWISLAFVLGLGVRLIGLPPLVGFLATGFLLNHLGMASGEVLQKLADLGITMLLFTVGLKMNLKVMLRPQVWAVTTLHLGLVIAIFGVIFSLLALIGAPLFANLDFGLNGDHDFFSYLVLQIEDVIDAAIETICPKVTTA